MNRQNWTRSILVAAVAASLSAQHLGAQNIPDDTVPTPEHVDLTLQPHVRWQFLRGSVMRVIPDQNNRPWYQLRPSSPPPPIDQAKDFIVSQSTKPDPQLSGIQPLLFEPHGRAWFLVYGTFQRGMGEGGPTLLGYDGKDFIERPAPRDARFNERNMTMGYGEVDRSACYVDGTAFFASGTGVSMFDGSAWSTRDFSTEDRTARGVQLYPEPDGKGVVVATGSLDRLWRWHDKKWTPIHTGSSVRTPGGYPNYQPFTVAPVSGGVWLLSQNRLELIPWSGEESATTAQLIDQLKSDRYETREAATNQLIGCGDTIADDIQSALVRNANNEARYRLEYILHKLEDHVQVMNEKARFGDFLIQQPLFLTTLSNGITLLGARSVSDPLKLSPPTTLPARSSPARSPTRIRRTEIPSAAPGGVLAMDLDGKVSQLGGEDLLAAFLGPDNNAYSTLPLGSQPLLVDHGNAAWVAARNAGLLSLIDLHTGKILRQTSAAVQVPIAALSDGTILCRSGAALLAYQPDAPETRLPLPAATSFEGVPCGQTADGAVWFFDAQGNLSRVDSQGTSPVAQGQNLRPTQCVVAGMKSLLVESRNRWFLVTPDSVVPADNLEDLIAAKPELFADFTNPPLQTRFTANTIRIQADAAGNIWLLNGTKRELKVFSHGTWLDTVSPLVKADHASGQITTLIRVGDGSRMYIADDNVTYPDNSPRCFVAGVNNGQITLAELPATNPTNTLTGPIITPTGGLWLSSRDPENGGSQASLVDQTGVIQTVKDLVPLACDGDGNLWAQSTVRNPAEWPDPTNPPFIVLRGNDRLTLPGLARGRAGIPQLIAARNGHMYFDTGLGLQELSLPPAGSTTAPPGRLFYFPDVPASANVMPNFASPDHLVLQGNVDNRIKSFIVPLPLH